MIWQGKKKESAKDSLVVCRPESGQNEEDAPIASNERRAREPPEII